MTLNEAYKEVVSYDSNKNGVVFAIESMHESATKLWIATVHKKDDEIIRTRAANTIISALYILYELGIENPEQCFQERLEELKKQKLEELKTEL